MQAGANMLLFRDWPQFIKEEEEEGKQTATDLTQVMFLGNCCTNLCSAVGGCVRACVGVCLPAVLSLERPNLMFTSSLEWFQRRGGFLWLSL